MKIAATLRTDLNLVTGKENLSMLYLTRDIKRGMYVITDHPETLEVLNEKSLQDVDDCLCTIREAERTIVLIPLEEVADELKKRQKLGENPGTADESTIDRSRTGL